MSRSSDTSLLSIGITLAFLAAVRNPLWVDPEGTVNTLENQGYTAVQTTGYSWFGCGKDIYSTGFDAVSPSGAHVSGQVCSGLIAKGRTVRFD
jgi:hypothetical protein